jgi:hypothetical protein
MLVKFDPFREVDRLADTRPLDRGGRRVQPYRSTSTESAMSSWRCSTCRE